MQAGQTHAPLCHTSCHWHAEPNMYRLNSGLHEMAMSVVDLLTTSQEEHCGHLLEDQMAVLHRTVTVVHKWIPGPQTADDGAPGLQQRAVAQYDAISGPPPLPGFGLNWYTHAQMCTYKSSLDVYTLYLCLT